MTVTRRSLQKSRTHWQEEQHQHDSAVLTVLSENSEEQPWWLGYLDTGADDIVFPDAPHPLIADHLIEALLARCPQRQMIIEQPAQQLPPVAVKTLLKLRVREPGRVRPVRVRLFWSERRVTVMCRV
jgi:hypothetical protein